MTQPWITNITLIKKTQILIALVVEDKNDQTGTLGINVVNEQVAPGSALLGEFLCTFFLMYTV